MLFTPSLSGFNVMAGQYMNDRQVIASPYIDWLDAGGPPLFFLQMMI